MDDEGLLTMTEKERERAALIKAVVRREMTQALAGRRLKLSVRQVKRLCRALRRGGVRALLSRRRGRASNRRIASAERERVLGLVRERYSDFGPTLAAEYLHEHHGYEHSVETLRQWMLGAGLWRAKRQRRKRAFQLRERRPRVGELIQVDGSPHAWLEARAERCTLIAFIDDASAALSYARFEPAETTNAYLRGLRDYVRRFGRPLALYSDRHSIFRKHDPEDPMPTQFERAMRELDIEPILALTPQAKGRVERAFQTLQDRLVKALRLAGIATLEAANAFLPSFVERYNARFARAAALPEDAHHSAPATEALRLATCQHHTRVLSKSLSCQFRGLLYQIDTGGAPAYALQGARVSLCEDFDEQYPLVLLNGQRRLAYRTFQRAPRLAEQRSVDDKTLDSAVELARKRRAAAQGRLNARNPNHPWCRDLAAAAALSHKRRAAQRTP